MERQEECPENSVILGYASLQDGDIPALAAALKQPESRVIVILQDVPPRLPPSPTEKLRPPSGGHGYAGGEMMAGRDIAPVSLPEEPPAETAPRFDLSTGAVDTALFPFRTWGRIQKELLYNGEALLRWGNDGWA